MTDSTVLQIKKAAKENDAFRKVLFTGPKTQVVLMSLRPGEDIGTEVHTVDQLLYAVKGDGVAVINGKTEPFQKGSVFCVVAGTTHDIVNTGDEPMKLFTIYAPPQHPAGTIHQTKADAQAAESRTAEPAIV